MGEPVPGSKVPKGMPSVTSIQVGRPREVAQRRRGRPVSTAIFKEPVDGRVMLRTLNLDGDQQADLAVHGGVLKAVYVYPMEHYEYWRRELPEAGLPYGAFGENLTVRGLSEATARIGDRYRIGGAEVRVTQPRLPCYKLGVRFGRPDMLKRFLASRRTGWYLAVTREGEIGADDAIERIGGDADAVTIADVTELYVRDHHNVEMLRRAVATPGLPEKWREFFAERLGESGAAQ
jgi:MOSC domain-containing protein YiiM